MYTSTYLKKNIRPFKIFTHPGPGGSSWVSQNATYQSQPTAMGNRLSIPWARKARALADTHSPLSQISLTEQLNANKTYETLVWTLCCQGRGSLAWMSAQSQAVTLSHALCMTQTFSPLPPLCHICGPGISMTVKSFSAAPITPRRYAWYLGNKEFWDWEISLWTAR